jgi:glycosyltransferase involved in cell wall biosynthesis
MQSKFDWASGTAIAERPSNSTDRQVLRKPEQNGRRYRLAILTSHVIQYQDPLFRKLAAEKDIDATVFFCSDWGAVPYSDPGFGTEVRWDLQGMRQGYHSEVLRNWSLRPNASRFWGLVNPQISARLATGNFDAVWVHGWSNCTSWIAMLTAFALRIPVLLRGENHRLSPPASSLRAALKRAVLTPLFRQISAFLAIGSLNSDFYRDYGAPENRIFAVPYCVDNEKFLTRAEALKPSRASIRAHLGISENAPVVLFSGKLIPNKAPMDLLLAFEEAVATCPAHLIFVGDGQLAPELKAYVARRKIPNVHFSGFRNQSELPELFVAADVFVLPSRFERWGLVVNEALCFGLPVIASDQVGAAGDLVVDGQNGLVFSSGDVSALRNCLLKLLADEALRGRMAQVSRRRVFKWNFETDIAGIRASLEAVAKATS